MNAPAQTPRFEKPKFSGLRKGISPCAFIGRKLEIIYSVPDQASNAIDSLLQELERKTSS